MPLYICYTIRMATENKTQKTKEPVSAYIARLPAAQQGDARILLKLFREATGKRPVMWGERMVGFGEYRYVSPATGRSGNWLMTGFAMGKQHTTIYLMNGVRRYTALLKDLGPYTNASSCLYIKRLSAVRLPVLRRVIKKSCADITKKYGG